MENQVTNQPQASLQNSAAAPHKNPFVHLVRGTKRFFTTDFVPAFLIMLLTLVVNTIFSIALVALVLNKLIFGFGSGIDHQLPSLFGSLVVILILFLLVQAFFGEAFSRVILSGVRKEKIGVGGALRVAGRRLGLTLGAYGLLVVAFVVSVALISVLARFSPILGIIGMLALLVCMVLVALNQMYLPFALIDDDKPESVMGALRRSANVWGHSRGASFLYILFVVILAIVLSALTGNHSNTNSYAVNNGGFNSGLTGSQALFGGSILSVGLIVAAVLITIVSAFIVSGLADIYSEVRALPTQERTPAAPNPDQTNTWTPVQ